ncbi:hypothetical protein [Streptomyces varsoviensis]|uniref:Secreted protein n=1 Tax=Streptomyces varsoviensis TaxID=67373 RepID=A0ABR5IQD0_9ACTN|nr:hypothetical protein [Streptomyces varsoviensis]KOG30671.1 hypothetical protein ADK38_48135 [Streptomyces varsoviensis]
MSNRHTTKALRSAAAVALTATMAIAVTGCGGDSGGQKSDKGASKESTGPRADGGKKPAAQSTTAIGEMKGPDGIVVTLNSAIREDGGFITVNGTLTNRGSKVFNAYAWRSKETEMRSQSSISGASLVDAAGKKRYLILRDTDGECLCSTGLYGIKPNESRPIFAQFPAPPQSVTQVDFQLPSMPTVNIKITG